MMPSDEAHIAHSRFLSQPHPLVRIEIPGIEIFLARLGISQFTVFLYADTLILHIPFALSRPCVHPPVDEHAQLAIQHPFYLLVRLHGNTQIGLHFTHRSGWNPVVRFLVILSRTYNTKVVQPGTRALRIVLKHHFHLLPCRSMKRFLELRPSSQSRRNTDVVFP